MTCKQFKKAINAELRAADMAEEEEKSKTRVQRKSFLAGASWMYSELSGEIKVLREALELTHRQIVEQNIFMSDKEWFKIENALGILKSPIKP